MDIVISDERFRKAAAEGMDAFLALITDAYLDALGGELTAGNMSRLNGWQHVLMSYRYFQQEVMEGGFCQLIQNGLGPYIFDNPFAKVMREVGLHDFSKMLYKAKRVYDENKQELTRERTDDEFMAMYEQFPQFDDLEDWFIENEEDITAHIAHYVDEHLDDFLHDGPQKKGE